MKYSIEEIMDAVRDELSESNEMIGKKRKLYDKDYMIMGVIRCAAQRLEQKQNVGSVAASYNPEWQCRICKKTPCDCRLM